MSKHTPGPWMASKDNCGAIPLQWQPHCVLGNGGTVIVARLPDGDGPSDRANVALLAAAPDLLKACTELIRHFCPSTDKQTAGANEWFRFALAAIAKAKGARP